MRALILLVILVAPAAALPAGTEGGWTGDAGNVPELAAPLPMGEKAHGTVIDIAENDDYYRYDASGPGTLYVQAWHDQFVQMHVIGDRTNRCHNTNGARTYCALAANVHEAGPAYLHAAYDPSRGTAIGPRNYSFVASFVPHEFGSNACVESDVATYFMDFEPGVYARVEWSFTANGGQVPGEAFHTLTVFENAAGDHVRSQLGSTAGGIHHERLIVSARDAGGVDVDIPDPLHGVLAKLSTSRVFEHTEVRQPWTPIRAWLGAAGSSGVLSCFSIVADEPGPLQALGGGRAIFLRAEDLGVETIQIGPYLHLDEGEASWELDATSGSVLIDGRSPSLNTTQASVIVTAPTSGPQEWSEDYEWWTSRGPDIMGGGSWSARLRDIRGDDGDRIRIAAISWPIPLPSV